MNIATALRSQVSDHPDAIAIIDGPSGRERRHSYAVLELDATRAAALLHHYGVRKGDHVLVFQPMSYELYVVLLAIFRLGAVAMFLDPSAGRAHINQCCEIGTPSALIASGRAQILRLISPRLQRIPLKFTMGYYAPGAVAMRSARNMLPFDDIVTCTPEDPALLTFTSGSTGRPKAALRSQGFLFAQHQALARALKLKGRQIDLTTLPIFLLANLASGMTSVVPDADLRFPGRIKPASVVAQIEEFGVTRSAGSPAFYKCLVEYCEARNKVLAGLRRIDTGGAPVFPPLLDRLQKMAPHAEVVVVYGSTEAEPMAHAAWSGVDAEQLSRMRSGHGLLAGKPVPDVTLCILPDHFGKPIGPFTTSEFEAECLPVGEIGEIVVTGEHVLKAYFHGMGDNETKFEVAGQRWHRTGDAGYLDTGGCLWLVGRCNARIHDAKGTLYPFMVECAAQFVPGVQRSALIGHKGQRILLVECAGPIELTSHSTSMAWAELDEVRLVDHVPVDKRHNGKVDYTQIQTLLEK